MLTPTTGNRLRQPLLVGTGVLFMLGVLTALRCEGSRNVGTNDNQGCALPSCVEDEDCPFGAVCIQQCWCVYEDLDGSIPPNPPSIVVEPTVLDFGSALLNVELTLPVTVRNRGDEDLVITAITIDEPGLLDEFRSAPEGALDPPIVIGSFSTITINVVLRAEDAELDYGLLLIDSNDPDQPRVSVELVAGCKCAADIEVCALDLALAEPVPFQDCVLDAQGEPIIDFGSIPGPVDASQLVVVANLADGNFPLTVTGVTTTDVGGQWPLYLVELFRREEDPGTGQTVEVPAALPVVLSAGDPVMGVPPDLLFVRIWLDTQMHGSLPADDLVIDSDDPADPQLAIPIHGQILGAPAR
ncbi:MAG: hypothetical protein ABI333_29220 [bacterium]